ncbi:DinB family protein [Paenibacillus pinihumi]|uniref:DinB family protein n=1 Tax=Paenibacillus pinihumi TaxID=669462 RepID=UPI000417D361|nr:DinB family protein [Paenibacillus pinihumi]
MESKQELISNSGAFIDFVRKLQPCDEQIWIRPLGPQKWTIKEVVAHLLFWDQYFYEEVIRKIVLGQPLTLTEDIDVEAFNQKSAAWALSRSKDEIVQAAVSSRTAILEALRVIPAEDYTKEYTDADGARFVLQEFLVENFGHDQHHRGQIIQAIEPAGSWKT